MIIMLRNVVVSVNVSFPALDGLVAYLKACDDQQKQIDALTAQVGELTKGLQQSESALKGSVVANQPQ